MSTIAPVNISKLPYICICSQVIVISLYRSNIVSFLWSSYIVLYCYWSSRIIYIRVRFHLLEEIFNWENFSGQVPTESLRTQDSENVYERWVQQIFDPVSVGRSWMSAKKWGPLAKLLGVAKKSHSHNFRIWAFKFKSLVAIDYGNKWFTFGSSNSKIVGVGFFCNGSF